MCPGALGVSGRYAILAYIFAKRVNNSGLESAESEKIG